MAIRKDPQNNSWKPIPGFGGIYEIDYYGNIRRMYGKGQRTITPSINKYGYKKVRLTDPDGQRREYRVHRLMAETYLTVRPGMCLKFKNGIKTDTCLGNLEWITKTDLGKKTGANSRRQPVIKIDQSGEVVGFYPSAREAARNNFMSYQTIMDRCNGKCKSRYAPDGFKYEWDDIKMG